jgi:hypothetical protein
VVDTASIDAATNWPSGGANGTFGIAIGVIDATTKRYVSTVEKIRVGARTGTTLSSMTRGVDGTSALSHTAGETVRHILFAEDIDEANEHINNTGLDHHTQYHTAARHAAVPHTSAMLQTDSVGTDEIAANAVTSSELANNAVTAGKIASGGISASAMFASGVVDAAAIATDAVGSAEIAADAVGASELADASVAQANFVSPLAAYYIAATASDPGAVGNGKLWFDTTTRQLKARNAANSGWELISEVITPWTDYTPTFQNVTLGTGGIVYGRYSRMGKTVVGVAGFRLGTSGNVTGQINMSLPSSADFSGTNFVGHAEWLGAARGSDVSASQRWAAVGRITDGDAGNLVQFATAGVGGWDANTPFDWGNPSAATGDLLAAFFMYEEA